MLNWTQIINLVKGVFEKNITFNLLTQQIYNFLSSTIINFNSSN